MKRVLMIIVLSLFMFGKTESVFAQLKEVKGVETKWVVNRETLNWATLYYNYEFINRNPFSVTVEAELWTSYDAKNYIKDTKVFILGPSGSYNGSYEWKLDTPDRDRRYVKYKAYKNEE